MATWSVGCCAVALLGFVATDARRRVALQSSRFLSVMLGPQDGANRGTLGGFSKLLAGGTLIYVGTEGRLNRVFIATPIEKTCLNKTVASSTLATDGYDAPLTARPCFVP
jgi:hypothetical protein